MGCCITRPTESSLRCTGKLTQGNYCIDGSVSSQYVSGLLFALSIIRGKNSLTITGKIESAPYIEMTRQAIKVFHADPDKLGQQTLCSPGKLSVEGDWSNGAFFLTAASLGNSISVMGLNPASSQGDRAVSEHLFQLATENQTIDAADIPDLVPILSVAATQHGATFTSISRLRLKESDRVTSVCAMLNSLGIQTKATENTLQVFPGKINGGIVNSFGDHRIAMSAAIAATVATAPVTILDAECVSKSYPGFWAEYARLGGNYEQYLR
jgi:3-phosphoshikimate 1-carboxyvinyltransferase